MRFVCRSRWLDSRAAFWLARGGKRPGENGGGFFREVQNWRHALAVRGTRARFRTRRTTSRPLRLALVVSAGKRKASGLAPTRRMAAREKRLRNRIRER